jgi:hypothetical protein
MQDMWWRSRRRRLLCRSFSNRGSEREHSPHSDIFFVFLFALCVGRVSHWGRFRKKKKGHVSCFHSEWGASKFGGSSMMMMWWFDKKMIMRKANFKLIWGIQERLCARGVVQTIASKQVFVRRIILPYTTVSTCRQTKVECSTDASLTKFLRRHRDPETHVIST